jgi:hypothetical protein
VLAIPLLMSPFLYFWEMSRFEPRELFVTSRRATNLATHLPAQYDIDTFLNQKVEKSLLNQLEIYELAISA